MAVQVGDAVLDPTERKINLSEVHDIASFRLSTDDIALRESASRCTRRSPGRPSCPSPNGAYSSVVFVVWSAKRKDGALTSVSDHKIAIQSERDHWYRIEGVREPSRSEPWGGTSGGPVFALYETDIITWALVGIDTEFNQSLEIVFADTLSDLMPSGELTS